MMDESPKRVQRFPGSARALWALAFVRVLLILPGPGYAESAREIRVQFAERLRTPSWTVSDVELPASSLGPDSLLLRSDLNGDGRDEVLLRQNGKSSLWQGEFLERGFRWREAVLLPESFAHAQAGLGDLEGDGSEDLVWKQPTESILHSAHLAATAGNEKSEALQFLDYRTPNGLALFPEAVLSLNCGDGGRPGIVLRDFDGTSLRCLTFQSGQGEVAGEFPFKTPFFPWSPYRINPREQSILFFEGGTGLFFRPELGAVDIWRLWADFSPFNPFDNWKGRLLGDFDGDGSDDLLTYGGSLSDSRIAYGKGGFAIEDDFPWPGGDARHAVSPVAGDFNADGLSDLAFLTFSGKTPRLRLALQQPRSTRLPFSLLVLRLPLFFGSIVFAEASLPIQFTFVEDEDSKSLDLPGANGVVVELFLPERSAEWESQYLRREIRLKKLEARPLVSVLLRHESPFPQRRTEGQMFREGSISNNRPRVCIGYVPFHEQPNLGVGKWQGNSILCPPGYAYYAFSEGNSHGPACSVSFSQCCPLPADDILMNEHVFVAADCPWGWVATGIMNSTEKACEQKIRCSRVNQKRYELGVPEEGLYWGSGLSSRGQGEHRILSDIPEAIRYGVMRSGLNGLWVDGCIGPSYGSLLSRKGGSKCREQRYQQLLYSGIPGDPERGTPVTMFPDCRLIEDPFWGNSGCYLK